MTPSPYPFTGFLLACAMALHASLLSAQTPSGYLGKRQIAELSADFNPFGLIADQDPSYGLTPGVGVGFEYHYVVRERLTLGASVSYRSFGSPVDDGDVLADPTTELTVVAELNQYSRARGGLAPLGGGMSYGFGVVRTAGAPYAGTSGRRPRTLARISRVEPLVRIGYAYRYVFADRVTVTPFSRVDASARVFDRRGDYFNEAEVSDTPLVPRGVGLFWRMGVRVGLVY